eukprot:SAG31_NODE_544_length_14245_cov_68.376644_8_plen_158_part_00
MFDLPSKRPHLCGQYGAPCSLRSSPAAWDTNLDQSRSEALAKPRSRCCTRQRAVRSPSASWGAARTGRLDCLSAQRRGAWLEPRLDVPVYPPATSAPAAAPRGRRTTRMQIRYLRSHVRTSAESYRRFILSRWEGAGQPAVPPSPYVAGRAKKSLTN